MNKKLIKLTEQDLHNIVKESVNRILVKEFDDWDAHLQQDDPDPEEKGVFYDDGTEDIYDYAGNYEELIKDELHNLYELERKVPYNLRTEIHQCVSTLQSILSDINMRNDIARI